MLAKRQVAQPPTPQWQIDAGGKMEFDVASVKQDTTPLSPQTVHSNVPLGPQDMYSPTGGLLSATNFPLLQYMVFAYKLTSTQFQSVQSQLPKWATTNRYDIQARVAGNPTKDQFRLMMQALLADRFKLAIHYEIKQQPIFALVLDKPGKLGPKLQPHPADSPCSTAGDAPGGTATNGYRRVPGVVRCVLRMAGIRSHPRWRAKCAHGNDCHVPYESAADWCRSGSNR